ncbi:MAG: ATP-binding protein, partial [Streptomycetaceae bacterium]|nr:ATP-binding protein [Streptomycetaceae bacterium]
RGTPFVVGANCFDGRQGHTPEAIRDALDLVDPTTPVLMFDARDRASTRDVMLALMDRLIARADAAKV